MSLLSVYKIATTFCQLRGSAVSSVFADVPYPPMIDIMQWHEKLLTTLD